MLVIPNNLELGDKFSSAIDFFIGKRETAPTINIFGLEHSYTLGGLHASLKNCRFVESDNLKIVDIDFSSYYAYIMLRYVPWFWKGMSKNRFKDIVSSRILAKWNGDSGKAKELKQKIAPAYGQARKQSPDGGLAICAIGQLFLSDLLSKLERISGITLINTDTDGIIIAYPASLEDRLITTVEEFKARVKIPIEYQEIHEIYQQERTYYVAELGETYTFRDGNKLIIAPDSHKFKVRGKTCVDIVKKAIAENLLYGANITDVITSCNDLSSFRYSLRRNPLETAGYRWHAGNKWLKLPDCIDIYAVTKGYLGEVASIGYDCTIPKKLAATSTHSLVDINNAMDLEILDKQFYIDEATGYIELWNKKKHNNERTT